MTKKNIITHTVDITFDANKRVPLPDGRIGYTTVTEKVTATIELRCDLDALAKRLGQRAVDIATVRASSIERATGLDGSVVAYATNLRAAEKP